MRRRHRGRQGAVRLKVEVFDAATGALSGDARTIDADCLLVSAGWSPLIHLASQAGASAEMGRRLQAFLPPEPRRTGSAPAPSAAVLDGRGAGRRPVGRTARRGSDRRDTGGARGRQSHALDLAPGAALRDPGQGQGLRRFPERRDGRRRAARPARGLRLGRAPEALHHARHGDRPGQDLERERPRHHGRGARHADPGGRHDALPPALHSGLARRARRRTLWRPQARSADAAARLACRARRDDVCRRPVAAPA